MAEYTKDKRFSLGWVIGGALLMVITNVFGGFVAGAASVTDIYSLLGIALGCFALGGFVIGWQSEGSTIVEAGLAAAIAVVGVALIRGIHFDAQSLAFGAGLPFVAGIIGAWLGEKVQGDVIHTKDD